MIDDKTNTYMESLWLFKAFGLIITKNITMDANCSYISNNMEDFDPQLPKAENDIGEFVQAH